MALSDDQRAMLRLLAQREEGYEDIAALKGMSVEEVRAEVKEALAQLAEDREAAVEPAPPVEPPASREPAKAEEPPEPAKEEPRVEGPSPSPAKPSAPAKPAARRPRPSVPPERRRLLLLTGGALGVVAVVLIAIAVFSDGSDSASSTGPQTVALSESAPAKNAKVTKALLKPVNGGDAEGLVLFGRLRKEVVLQIAAKGLEPAPRGKAYVLWLASPKQMVPLTPLAVDKSGVIAAQHPVPAQVIVYLAKDVFNEIDISLLSVAAYKAAFSKANKEKKQPAYTGADVLRGRITGPIVGAAIAAGG